MLKTDLNCFCNTPARRWTASVSVSFLRIVTAVLTEKLSRYLLHRATSSDRFAPDLAVNSRYSSTSDAIWADSEPPMGVPVVCITTEDNILQMVLDEVVLRCV